VRYRGAGPGALVVARTRYSGVGNGSYRRSRRHLGGSHPPGVPLPGVLLPDVAIFSGVSAEEITTSSWFACQRRTRRRGCGDQAAGRASKITTSGRAERSAERLGPGKLASGSDDWHHRQCRLPVLRPGAGAVTTWPPLADVRPLLLHDLGQPTTTRVFVPSTSQGPTRPTQHVKP
jgi:hypothetical protein